MMNIHSLLSFFLVLHGCAYLAHGEDLNQLNNNKQANSNPTVGTASLKLTYTILFPLPPITMAPISPSFQPIASYGNASPIPYTDSYSLPYISPTVPYTMPATIPYTSPTPQYTIPASIPYTSPTLQYTIPATVPFTSASGIIPVSSGEVGPVASSFDPFSTGVNVQPTITGSVYDPLNPGSISPQVTPVQVVMNAASNSGSAVPPEGTYIMIRSEQGDSWLLPYTQESMGKGPVVVFGKTDQSKSASNQLQIHTFFSHRNLLLSLFILFMCH